MGGDLDFYSITGGVLSIKSSGSTVTAPASTMTSASTTSLNPAGTDYNMQRLVLPTTLFEATDDPITVNFMVDISRDFTDAATADSLLKDIQTPATITSIVGTANPSDALDFNATGDRFAEGDGAYVYTSFAGVAHFKFVDNTVTHFNPAFRIKNWTHGILPEYLIVDNQVLTFGYQYNAYLNNATSELIMQFNKTFTPGTHFFYISHKTGLAVKLNKCDVKNGEGVDTLQWTTESEFENLGFNIYRRIASADSAAQTLTSTDVDDTLPSMLLTAEELALLGYERLTARLIPGVKGGSSASTQNYQYIDRTASFGIAYEYLLEAVDFNGAREQYGPRIARPMNPFFTELYPNYPNPFNPITTLHFSLKEKAKVSLVIYDGKGKMVRTMLRPDKEMLPGKYRLIWDARDNSGLNVPSGQYFYRFTAPHYHKTRKMILVN
jgi:hypothetical protein